MGIDTSMYSNFKLPDFVGSYMEGKEWRQKQDDRAKQTKNEDAMKGIYKLGPDGKMVIDQAALQQFGQANPEGAYKIQRDLDDARIKEQSLIDERNYKRDMLAATREKNGASEGFKSADKDYGKDYNDFTGGGETKAVDAIAKLRGWEKKLTDDNGLIQAGGGPISGSLPDAFRTEASISQRDNIVSAANSALKATFGGQLSDGERKALANEFYNDKLSNKENLAIISQKIMELENGLGTQRAKASHFKQRGTLVGFDGSGAAKSSTKVAKESGASGGWGIKEAHAIEMPKIGTVEEWSDGTKYIFNGGNPGDPKSWRKK